ncbi:hypothetical protein AB0B50_02065 [Streptomyces sp. NPDC041068]|uniref:hypothetical protein n=1 Tax=Streptomyces sp. NPDC041068 TaxID=3155130 RepID=UPI0033D78207
MTSSRATIQLPTTSASITPAASDGPPGRPRTIKSATSGSSTRSAWKSNWTGSGA